MRGSVPSDPFNKTYLPDVIVHELMSESRHRFTAAANSTSAVFILANARPAKEQLNPERSQHWSYCSGVGMCGKQQCSTVGWWRCGGGRVFANTWTKTLAASREQTNVEIRTLQFFCAVTASWFTICIWICRKPRKNCENYPASLCLCWGPTKSKDAESKHFSIGMDFQKNYRTLKFKSTFYPFRRFDCWERLSFFQLKHKSSSHFNVWLNQVHKRTHREHMNLVQVWVNCCSLRKASFGHWNKHRAIKLRFSITLLQVFENNSRDKSGNIPTILWLPCAASFFIPSEMVSIWSVSTW